MCVSARKKEKKNPFPRTMARDHPPRKCASINYFLYGNSSDELTEALSDVNKYISQKAIKERIINR